MLGMNVRRVVSVPKQSIKLISKAFISYNMSNCWLSIQKNLVYIEGSTVANLLALAH